MTSPLPGHAVNALKHNCDQYLHLIEVRAYMIALREVELLRRPAGPNTKLLSANLLLKR